MLDNSNNNNNNDDGPFPTESQDITHIVIAMVTFGLVPLVGFFVLAIARFVFRRCTGFHVKPSETQCRIVLEQYLKIENDEDIDNNTTTNTTNNNGVDIFNTYKNGEYHITTTSSSLFQDGYDTDGTAIRNFSLVSLDSESSFIRGNMVLLVYTFIYCLTTGFTMSFALWSLGTNIWAVGHFMGIAFAALMFNGGVGEFFRNFLCFIATIAFDKYQLGSMVRVPSRMKNFGCIKSFTPWYVRIVVLESDENGYKKEVDYDIPNYIFFAEVVLRLKNISVKKEDKATRAFRKAAIVSEKNRSRINNNNNTNNNNDKFDSPSQTVIVSSTSGSTTTAPILFPMGGGIVGRIQNKITPAVVNVQRTTHT